MMPATARYSETSAWNLVQALAHDLIRHAHDPTKVTRLAEHVATKAGEMVAQVERGVHLNPGVNPPFVLYGNPPLRTRRGSRGTLAGSRVRVEIIEDIGQPLHEIKYEHTQDGKPYQHEFGESSAMAAAMIGDKNVALIYDLRGRPVWEEFP